MSECPRVCAQVPPLCYDFSLTEQFLRDPKVNTTLQSPKLFITKPSIPRPFIPKPFIPQP